MNIAQGLKEKNRIAGRIVQLQKQVETNNQYVKGKETDFDSRELLIKLQEEWAHLIDIKTKIAKANVGIADKLVQLTEAKAELQFWNGFFNAGPAELVEVRDVRIGGEYTPVTTVTISTITSKEVVENRQRVQSLIESLQDEIDNFNAVTVL